MIDTLLRRLETICKFCAYADNLLLFVQRNLQSEMERVGTNAIRFIKEWGDEVGVQIAKEKSAIMLLKGTMSQNRPRWSDTD